MIRKLGLLVPSAVCLIFVLAAPALAGSELPPPDNPNVEGVVVQPPNVEGVVVQPPGATGGIAFTRDHSNVQGVVVQPPGATGGIAFTGGNVRMWMVLAAALLVVGAALLIAGRRRRANAAP
jgi:hypothetical protein